jgi:dTDP-glucose 4,6-dehydratase
VRCLITGGAGFLGSHLTDRLLDAGHEVIIFDNLITGREDNLAHHFGHPSFRFVKQDVTEFIYLPGQLDAVVHFASPASPIDYLRMPIPTLKVGSLGTHKALGLSKAKNARFLLASTSEVYGDPQVHPQPESYWGHVNPVGPRGVYDEAKRFAEAITMAYHRYHGVDTRIVRIFNTYGPRMRPHDGRVVSNFIVQALTGAPLTIYGQGEQTRSFTYVDDLIDGIWRLLMHDDTGPSSATDPSAADASAANPPPIDPDAVDIHQPVNIGNPVEFTVAQLADLVLEFTGSQSEIEYRPLPVDDPKVRQPDITRARKLLGFEPRVPLEQGLQNTIPYFREQVEATGPLR